MLQEYIRGFNMKSKYQLEIDSFRKQFAKFQEKKISIYGIGRRTATLLPGISDFNIVGLLDYDENNIGRIICGIPVIPLRKAEKESDIMIINSDPTNYQIIYRRLIDVKIPVYYANGEKAAILEVGESTNPYWESNIDMLKQSIEKHEVVSFDLFDTLLMRKVLSPSDVFRILDRRAKEMLLIPYDLDFAYIRQESTCDEHGIELMFEEIYNNLSKKINLSQESKKTLMRLELDIEKTVCCPRRTMVKMLSYALSLGKETYIISDTYFEKKQIQEIMEKCGIEDFSQSNIFLSSEEKCYKRDGSLWRNFSDRNNNKRILHIGDNIVSDIQEAQRFGIDTFYVMSGRRMLEESSLSGLLSVQKTFSDCVHLGLVISHMFNDPFALSKTHGKLHFEFARDFGYIVFGGVLCRFLMWLHGNVLKNQIDRVLFFARDGYFLIRDYRHLLEQLKFEAPDMKYVEISRRLLYLITTESEDDIWKVAMFPYVGDFPSYLKSRFNIEPKILLDELRQKKVDSFTDIEEFKTVLRPYKEEILEEAKKEKKNYIRYLSKAGIIDSDKKDAIVDLGFYGTNQFFFQKLLNRRVDGYYFSACYSKDNEYISECNINGCFNSAEDPKAEHSNIKQKNAFLESFLTAPYGMLRFVNEHGQIVCESPKTNQKNFSVKVECNDGVQEYIKDYVEICGLQNEAGYITSEAFTYYAVLSGGATIDSSIKKGFFFDNDMVGTKEMQLDI